MKPKVEAQLLMYVDADIDPMEMAAAAKVTPLKVWRFGQIRRPGAEPNKSSGWAVSSEQLETWNISDAFQVLSEKIRGSEGFIRDALSKYSALLEFSFVVYNQEGMPSINFDAEQVSYISSLGASVDVDVI